VIFIFAFFVAFSGILYQLLNYWCYTLPV